MDPEQYDHRRTALLEDPDSVHQPMRSGCPVAHSDLYGGFTVLTRYEEVLAATRDTATFSSLPTVTLPSVGAPRPFIPVESDPPDHQAYRALLNTFFGPRRIEGFEPQIRQTAVALLEEIVPRGAADLATEFVFPLTSSVICWFLGLPTEDVPKFIDWSNALSSVKSEGDERELQDVLRDYYGTIIERAKREPGSDLASHLLASEISGRKVTEQEILDLYLTLTGAGSDTTASAANNSFVILDKRRDVRAGLIEHPDLIPSAVDELLRYVTPVYGFRRTTTAPVTILDVPIPAGESVWLSWLSANHDEREFANPAEIQVDRNPNRHLAFGGGVHRCPGAPLARLQLRVMIEELLARAPDYTVTDHHAAAISEGINRVIKSVPVTFA